jgi:hypothetical protein
VAITNQIEHVDREKRRHDRTVTVHGRKLIQAAALAPSIKHPTDGPRLISGLAPSARRLPETPVAQNRASRSLPSSSLSTTGGTTPFDRLKIVDRLSYSGCEPLHTQRFF